MAAAVPRMAAMTDAQRATTRVLYRDVRISSLEKRSRYHRREKPLHTERDLLALKL